MSKIEHCGVPTFLRHKHAAIAKPGKASGEHYIMARPDFDPGTSQATSELGQQFTDVLAQTSSEDLDFEQAFSMALAIEELEQEGAA